MEAWLKARPSSAFLPRSMALRSGSAAANAPPAINPARTTMPRVMDDPPLGRKRFVCGAGFQPATSSTGWKPAPQLLYCTRPKSGNASEGVIVPRWRFVLRGEGNFRGESDRRRHVGPWLAPPGHVGHEWQS